MGGVALIDRRTLIAAFAASPLASLFRFSQQEPVPKFATPEQENLQWGTYGPKGDQPLKWVRLGDCETAHLEAILRGHHTSAALYVIAICNILRDRGVDGWDAYFGDKDKQLVMDGYDAAPEREAFRFSGRC